MNVNELLNNLHDDQLFDVLSELSAAIAWNSIGYRVTASKRGGDNETLLYCGKERRYLHRTLLIRDSPFFKSVFSKCFDGDIGDFKKICRKPSEYYQKLVDRIHDDKNNLLYRELRQIHETNIDNSPRISCDVCKCKLSEYGLNGIFIGNEASLVKAFQAEYVPELSTYYGIQREIINAAHEIYSIFCV